MFLGNGLLEAQRPTASRGDLGKRRMQIKTCQIGRALRRGDNTRIVIHRRQGRRMVLGVTAPAGTELIFGGAALRPMSGKAGTASFLFSLQSISQFTLGGFDVSVWLPGELVPVAADCEDWLHVGIASAGIGLAPALPAPVMAAPPCRRPRTTGAGLFLEAHE
jgi:hypothetical protein